MNPFFMQMMNFMGMGCGCMSGGMTMPYYSNDNLWFFNQPIFRDTSYDYLLDPNLALQNALAGMQSGNMFGGYGMNFLPGFSFPQTNLGAMPGIGTMQMPGMPGVSGMPGMPGVSGTQGTPGMSGAASGTQMTDEEKAEAEKKKTEAEKPAAKEAKALNDVFGQVKKLAEDKKNRFPEIPEELTKKAEEAMKKETAEEQLSAMKEVMALIPESTLRKTVLADDNVREMLRKAGYNFNIDNNKYSLKNNDIKTGDVDDPANMTRVHNDVVQKKYGELQRLAGSLSNTDVAKARILGVISTWNDKYKGSDGSILRCIGNNLPIGNDAVSKTASLQLCVKTIVEALIAKADEYDGCPKIKAARNSVNSKLIPVLKTNGLTKSNIDALAAAFDSLYARLRMQDAVAAKDYINKNFKYLNNAKPGVINNNMIVEETKKDLRNEGITAPALNQLDTPPVPEEIVVQNNAEIEELDSEYQGQDLLDKLVEKNVLTKAKGVYTSKEQLGTANRNKHFAVKDGKVYEVAYSPKTKKYVQVSQEEVTAAQINSYNEAVKEANALVKKNTLAEVPQKSKYPVFKATGANEYYIIKDYKFYHIVGAKNVPSGQDFVALENGGTKKLSALTEENLEEFSEGDIKTKAQLDAEKRAREMADVKKVQSYTFTSLNDLKSNEVLNKLSKAATGKDGNFKKAAVSGYFYCQKNNTTTRYYKYDIKTGTLKYLPDVKSISDSGYITRTNGKSSVTDEVFMDKVYKEDDLANKIQEYGKRFRTCLNGKTSSEELTEAHRKLNTIIALNNPIYTVNFIKGYNDNWGFWSMGCGICEQMTDENLPDGNAGQINTRPYYLKEIAKLIKGIVNMSDFDTESDDYKELCNIANGQILSKYENDKLTESAKIKYTARELDRIIKNVLAAYDKTNNEE